MKSQHGPKCKWRASGGFSRCNDRELGYKLTLGYHPFHEFKQFHLARPPAAQVQIKGLLVHSRIGAVNGASSVVVIPASGEF